MSHPLLDQLQLYALRDKERSQITLHSSPLPTKNRGTKCASGLLLFCFLFGACDLKAGVHKELHHVIGRAAQELRVLLV